MGSRSKQPMSWEDYEYGRSPRQGSTSSIDSHVQFDTPATPPGATSRLGVPSQKPGRETETSLRHRGSRSSISSRINQITSTGGPNSLENFARSWSRAAAFQEIPARRPSFLLTGERDEETLIGAEGSNQSPSPAEARSLLKQQFESQKSLPEESVDDTASVDTKDNHTQLGLAETGLSSSTRPTFLDRPSPLSNTYGSSLGNVYGSLPSIPQPHARSARTTTIFRPTSIEERKGSIGEQDPLLGVEQKDGNELSFVIGQSTLPQTIFNSVNILVGVGLLSLPLAFRQSGMLIGIVFLCLAAVTTRYTARVLAKCLDLDLSLVTFSDIAWKAFGVKARITVGLLFSIELLCACVALVILFADSLDALVPGIGLVEWKVFAGIILLPLSLVPLRLLSFTSVLGILSCLGIVILIFVGGIMKPQYPGSLREPAPVTLFPSRWSDVPLSVGLLMAPWGGHGVFPNIYRDMRHPTRYSRALNYTYFFTYGIDVVLAVGGYLMFGQSVRDEVTSNILLMKGYPKAFNVIITVFIAIIPLTKVPLNARPIYVIIEDLCRLKARSSNKLAHSLFIVLIRIFVLGLIVCLAIVAKNFDLVMGLLGAALAFSICIILPIAFHLKLFQQELAASQVALNWVLIVVSSILAIVSTIWVFLPKHVRQRLDGEAWSES